MSGTKPSAALGPKLDLLIIVYGSAAGDPTDDSRYGADQRRAEVKLSPRVPAEIAGNMRRMQDWAQDVVSGLGLELKHSQQWRCEFCGGCMRDFSCMDEMLTRRV